MKKYPLLFFISACLLSIGTVCSAEEIRLGLFSPEITQKKLKDIPFSVAEKKYTLQKSLMESWIREDGELIYDPDYLSEIENTNLCYQKKKFLCALAHSYSYEAHTQKKSYLYLDEDAVKEYIKDLALQVNRDPENARLSMEDGKVSVFSLSSKGISLDEAKSAELLINYFKDENQNAFDSLPYTEKIPEVSTNSIENMGITSLVGEGRSNFRGSPKNRIYNIKVATNRFHGVLIGPGEEFSFVKILGPVDGEHGYLPELVIKKDKTEPEFGGGICQVSTTAFRAAINSGLKITARRNHAYPVGYYNPQGMDATVYVPKPDLRFINNTPGYILVQTKIEGTELIFQFFGSNDGRKIEINGPRIISRQPDGSMKTTFSQKVFDKNGNVIIDEAFSSSYDSPSKYPHPGSSTDILTEKPKGWSDNEWREYKKAHGM